jgi:hypothetical protein
MPEQRLEGAVRRLDLAEGFGLIRVRNHRTHYFKLSAAPKLAIADIVTFRSQPTDKLPEAVDIEIKLDSTAA